MLRPARELAKNRNISQKMFRSAGWKTSTTAAAPSAMSPMLKVVPSASTG